MAGRCPGSAGLGTAVNTPNPTALSKGCLIGSDSRRQSAPGQQHHVQRVWWSSTRPSSSTLTCLAFPASFQTHPSNGLQSPIKAWSLIASSVASLKCFLSLTLSIVPGTETRATGVLGNKLHPCQREGKHKRNGEHRLEKTLRADAFERQSPIPYRTHAIHGTKRHVT